MDGARRAAVVTGAGRGIGRAAALALARAGRPVGLAARTAAQLEAVREEIEALGGRALVLPGDAADEAAVDRAVAATAEAFGPVEVAVAGAGQAFSKKLIDTGVAELEALLRVNTLGPFLLVRAAARHMLERRIPGRIVVVASTAAVRGMAYTSAYSASKHAVLGLVRSAALELAGRGITVNALCPGWVDTEMFEATLANIAEKTGGTPAEARERIVARIPARRVLGADEVARMLEYVVAAEGLTGQALVLDGGESL